MNVNTKIKPVLDPGFVPAVLWNRAYQAKVAETTDSVALDIALTRADGTAFRWSGKILPHTGDNVALNMTYVERIVKFLLWQKGGNIILVAGCDAIAEELGKIYSATGARAFDCDFIGTKIYGAPITVKAVCKCALPEETSATVPLGRNLNGNRIGFDLGGSDRKCAAVVNGEVVFSEEVVWDPYFQSDPQYHIDGINDSLKRAAAHLPGGKVDAIGGSSAGVYVSNEVRAASLFRGVSPEDFEKHIRRIFFTLKDMWKGIPFEVVNDGEVTALAGAMGMNDNAVLGVAMGTSEAAGYVDAEGHILPWLNELAFAPIDYAEDAPVDEWSQDKGVGALYFSQQAVARLAPRAGFDMTDPEDSSKKLPFPKQLVKVQEAMKAGCENAKKIYETIGVHFGYAIAHYADFYEIRNLLFLGRVSSGDGGQIIIDKANEVLATEFPELKINLCVPDEKTKRHGQAVAAASLPKA